MSVSLFRKEVLRNKINSFHGTVFLNIPPSYKLVAITLLICMMSFALIATRAMMRNQCTIYGYFNSEGRAEMLLPADLVHHVHPGDELSIDFIQPFARYSDIITITQIIPVKSHYKILATITRHSIDPGVIFSVKIITSTQTLGEYLLSEVLHA